MQRSLVVLAGATLAVAVFAVTPSAQAPTPTAAAARAAEAARTYTPGKTPWGHPDLQGSYTTTDENGVPMERPDQFPSSEGVSDTEFQRIVRERTERARASAGRIGGAETGAGPSHWYEHLDAKNSQLWLISDPASVVVPGEPSTRAARRVRLSPRRILA